MSIRLTLRDVAIGNALGNSRFMTTTQICREFWKDGTGKVGPKKACERRLRKLRRVGLIRAIEQPVSRAGPSKPYIWTLTKLGAEVMSVELGLDPKDFQVQPPRADPTYPFLTHLIHTTDMRIAFMLACEQSGITLAEWHDEKVLKSEGMKDYVYLISSEGNWYQAAVIPDAVFFLQHNEKKALFFVEVDESTVTVSPTLIHRRGWTRRVQTYLAYFDSEAYAERYGILPARVLTVTTTIERLDHLKKATEDEGGGIHFLFALFDTATDPANLLTEKIWFQAESDEKFSLMG